MQNHFNTNSNTILNTIFQLRVYVNVNHQSNITYSSIESLINGIIVLE